MTTVVLVCLNIYIDRLRMCACVSGEGSLTLHGNNLNEKADGVMKGREES